MMLLSKRAAFPVLKGPFGSLSALKDAFETRPPCARPEGRLRDAHCPEGVLQGTTDQDQGWIQAQRGLFAEPNAEARWQGSAQVGAGAADCKPVDDVRARLTTGGMRP
jgi:hypothetical protein